MAEYPSKNFIAGQWREGGSEDFAEIINPANKEVLVKIKKVSQQDVKNSISAAEECFQSWKKVSNSERAEILNKISELIKERADDYAEVLSLENGKSLAEAKAELLYGAGYFDFYAGQAKQISGRVIEESTEKKLKVLKEPVGVVGMITPWNFPQAMLARKLAAAFAAGCVCVAKPDHQTPLSALLLAKICEDAGVPKAALSVLVGDSEMIGKELMESSVVKKISFTGSTRVGKLLIEQSAKTVKRLSLELGGNAPFIVFESADIDKAVEGALASKYRNSGQTCVCSNRFFVHEKVLGKFKEKFSQAISELKVGSGLESSVKIGPLINQAAVDKNNKLLEDAKKKGAEVIQSHELSQKEGFFFPPTLLVSNDLEIDAFQEEIFGPISIIYPFQSEEEVLKLANSTPYGLASYFYSQDRAQIQRVHDALEFGMVGINSGRISSPLAPFGGIKESGYGREGGEEGIKEYQNLKMSLELL